jgi:hypothetical protein
MCLALKTPFEGFFYACLERYPFDFGDFRFGVRDFYKFNFPLGITFIGLCKCLILKEIYPVDGFDFCAKLLISLKKI